jgi:hypothetical protein
MHNAQTEVGVLYTPSAAPTFALNVPHPFLHVIAARGFGLLPCK